ncbi:hypothetical protein EKN56_00525 [Limnobaculum zhutongyuii]|uniref:DUF2846 domain-containing protein n=1 Tax=Limnobaculum zhutongyuii TaxID=2498113 RepID=A0A411WFN7_9GAMM|nr:hypothetical protein [Limnobaculum zhutongyuii]QBH95032.1 hypothetical protein EKN56_00525 [Limnobaculum zhutongyuii]TQS87628.1 hypothetical protein ELQ32_13395 [Limnobaculum zhutongyuii]
MKTGLFLLLIFICSGAWANCDDTSPDLANMLSHPIGSKEIIAVVKGSIHPEFDAEGQVYVDYFDITQSYGLTIPNGRYLLKVNRNWGNECHFYAEDVKLHEQGDGEGTIYLALSRIYGRTLVMPEGTGFGLSLNNNMVIYRTDDREVKQIEQRLFERHVLKGIPTRFWQRLKDND